LFLELGGSVVLLSRQLSGDEKIDALVDTYEVKPVAFSPMEAAERC
jgi:hypothetical protein